MLRKAIGFSPIFRWGDIDFDEVEHIEYGFNFWTDRAKIEFMHVILLKIMKNSNLRIICTYIQNKVRIEPIRLPSLNLALSLSIWTKKMKG
jgi:hypothetical protein